MKQFQTAALLESMAGNQIEYLEFLKESRLSSGIYTLAAGSTDPQQPHDEDEVYFLLAGKGAFTSNGKTGQIEKGTILYVAAKEVHRFHDIEEDLTLLVFFAAN
jgi:mannose-6-phosphate isomerase-like protein (cupin superfamily)